MALLLSFAGVGRCDDLADLALALESNDEHERTRAALKIGELGPEGAPAAPAMVCMLYLDSDTSRWFNPEHKYERMQDHPGVRALADVGVPAVPILVRVLERGPFQDFGTRWGGEACPSRERDPTWDGDLDVRLSFTMFVALALHQIGEAAVEPIAAALERTSEGAVWLLRPLVLFGPTATSAVPAILHALSHAAPYERYQFVQALGAIGPGAKDAIPVLEPYLADPELSKIAGWALQRIRQAGETP